MTHETEGRSCATPVCLVCGVSALRPCSFQSSYSRNTGGRWHLAALHRHGCAAGEGRRRGNATGGGVVGVEGGEEGEGQTGQEERSTAQWPRATNRGKNKKKMK